MGVLYIGIGLVLGNFIYQALPGHRNWEVAAERSWFQAIALGLVALMLALH